MLIAALLLFQHIAMPDLPAVEKNPYTSPADIDQGKRLYGGRCAGCHGPQGDGGKGANLATPQLSRGQTDLALYRTIRYGIPETEMPGHNMTQREIWQIAGYVRTLGRTGADTSAGDRGRGAALVSGKGACLKCHLLDGEGGHLGPQLTDIGRRRSPAYIRNKLLKPEQDIADSFSTVKLKTKTGQTITGFLMNEDTFSIQLRDIDTRLHSFWKQDLTQLEVHRRTVMPSYKSQLTPQELDDLVAYLASTGGAQ